MPVVLLLNHQDINQEIEEDGVETATAMISVGTIATKESSLSEDDEQEESCHPLPPNQTKKTHVGQQRAAINKLLDVCAAKWNWFGLRRKTLKLNNLHLSSSDIPMKDLNDTRNVGHVLYQLSLAHNPLRILKLSSSSLYMPKLQVLDLSYCQIQDIVQRRPDHCWHLPKLKVLNLSHNKLTKMPSYQMFVGTPELQVLDLSHNQIQFHDRLIKLQRRLQHKAEAGREGGCHFNLDDSELVICNVDIVWDLIGCEVINIILSKLKLLDLSHNTSTRTS